jgi:hypothetical protein
VHKLSGPIFGDLTGHVNVVLQRNKSGDASGSCNDRFAPASIPADCLPFQLDRESEERAGMTPPEYTCDAGFFSGNPTGLFACAEIEVYTL